MTVDTYKNFKWSDNRNELDYLTREINKNFFNWLGNSKSLKVIVVAGPQTIIQICEALCDWTKQFESGYPIPLKLVCAFCEPVFTVDGAKRVNALGRLHRYMLPYSYVKKNKWNPKSKYLSVYQEEVELQFRELQKRYPFLELPDLSYHDPDSEEGRRLIFNAAHKRIAEGRRPFDMIISGPNAFWIPRWMRKNAGEMASAFKKKKSTKFNLASVKIWDQIFYTYGFSWGIHPVGTAGDHFSYAEYVGNNPLERLIKNRRKRGCLALMGLGPSTMDDKRLLDITSGAEEFGIEYPNREILTPKNIHKYGQTMSNWCRNQIPSLMFGDGTPKYDHLGFAISKRIRVIFGPEAKSLRKKYLT